MVKKGDRVVANGSYGPEKGVRGTVVKTVSGEDYFLVEFDESFDMGYKYDCFTGYESNKNRLFYVDLTDVDLIKIPVFEKGDKVRLVTRKTSTNLGDFTCSADLSIGDIVTVRKADKDGTMLIEESSLWLAVDQFEKVKQPIFEEGDILTALNDEEYLITNTNAIVKMVEDCKYIPDHIKVVVIDHKKDEDYVGDEFYVEPKYFKKIAY